MNSMKENKFILLLFLFYFILFRFGLQIECLSHTKITEIADVNQGAKGGTQDPSRWPPTEVYRREKEEDRRRGDLKSPYVIIHAYKL